MKGITTDAIRSNRTIEKKLPSIPTRYAAEASSPAALSGVFGSLPLAYLSADGASDVGT